MPSRQLTFQVTWKCDIRCSHCFQEHTSPTLNANAALDFIDICCAKAIIDRVAFTGGEAFLKFELICEIARHVKKKWDLPFGVVTNARWAINEEIADARISQLIGLGLDHVTVSYDLFHAECTGIEGAEFVLRAAAKRQVGRSIYTVHRNADDQERNELLVKEISERYSVPVYPRSLLPVLGTDSGNHQPIASPFTLLSTACPSRNTIASIWPNGELLPCCTAGTHKNLRVGNIVRDDHELLIDRLLKRSAAAKIKELGINVLNVGLNEKDRQKIKSQKFVSPCHYCHKLASCHSESSINEVIEADVATAILSG